MQREYYIKTHLILILALNQAGFIELWDLQRQMAETQASLNIQPFHFGSQNKELLSITFEMFGQHTCNILNIVNIIKKNKVYLVVWSTCTLPKRIHLWSF